LTPGEPVARQISQHTYLWESGARNTPNPDRKPAQRQRISVHMNCAPLHCTIKTSHTSKSRCAMGKPRSFAVSLGPSRQPHVWRSQPCHPRPHTTGQGAAATDSPPPHKRRCKMVQAGTTEVHGWSRVGASGWGSNLGIPGILVHQPVSSAAAPPGRPAEPPPPSRILKRRRASFFCLRLRTTMSHGVSGVLAGFRGSRAVSHSSYVS
jgi:hypothetical protein